jgi:hypothetical protein
MREAETPQPAARTNLWITRRSTGRLWTTPVRSPPEPQPSGRSPPRRSRAPSSAGYPRRFLNCSPDAREVVATTPLRGGRGVDVDGPCGNDRTGSAARPTVTTTPGCMSRTGCLPRAARGSPILNRTVDTVRTSLPCAPPCSRRRCTARRRQGQGCDPHRPADPCRAPGEPGERVRTSECAVILELPASQVRDTPPATEPVWVKRGVARTTAAPRPQAPARHQPRLHSGGRSPASRARRTAPGPIPPARRGPADPPVSYVHSNVGSTQEVG